MREEALLFGKEDGVIGGEMEERFFAVDLHLRLGQRGFQSVGDAFVVGTEGDGEAVFGIDAQFVVALANSGELLPHRRVEHLIDAAFFGGFDLHVASQRGLVDADGGGGILEQDLAVEQHVILYAAGGADSDLDLLIGRVEGVGRLRGGIDGQEQAGGEERRERSA